MRARLGFLAVWTATTAAGIGITWIGVGDALRGTTVPFPDAAAAVPVLRGTPPASPGAPVPASPGPSTGASASTGPAASPRPTRASASPSAQHPASATT